MVPLPRNTHTNLMAKKPYADSVSLAECGSVKLLIYRTNKISCGVGLNGAKTSVKSPHKQTI